MASEETRRCVISDRDSEEFLSDSKTTPVLELQRADSPRYGLYTEARYSYTRLPPFDTVFVLVGSRRSRSPGIDIRLLALCLLTALGVAPTWCDDCSTVEKQRFSPRQPAHDELHLPPANNVACSTGARLLAPCASIYNVFRFRTGAHSTTSQQYL